MQTAIEEAGKLGEFTRDALVIYAVRLGRLQTRPRPDVEEEPMTNTYNAEVTRDGKWWMVAIPEIDGLTQARSLSEAELMARQYIAVTLGLRLDDVAVNLI